MDNRTKKSESPPPFRCKDELWGRCCAPFRGSLAAKEATSKEAELC